MATKIVTKNSSTASAVPTASDLVQGELAVNVADKRLFTEDNGGAIVELGTNPSGNVTFQDNGKAIFGAGSDLQIYHDGSNSWIQDAGTGVLALKTDGVGISMLTSTGDTLFQASRDSDVRLYYDNALKIATTSTGIDVTGTATMDGLNIDTTTPFMSFKESGATKLFIGESSAVGGGAGYYDFYAVTGLGQRFFTNSLERMRIDSSGNVLVGTTTTAPGAGNTVAGVEIRGGSDNRSFFSASSNYAMHLNRNTSDGEILYFAKGGTAVGIIGTQSGRLTVGSNSASGVRFDGTAVIPMSGALISDNTITLGDSGFRFKDLYLSGNISAGTGAANANNYQIKVSAGTTGLSRFIAADTSDAGYIDYEHSSDSWIHRTAGAERMRIDGSGNLLIGKTTTGVAGAGTVIRAGGELFVTRAGDVMNLNRLTSDGEIAVFRKDGASVGSIGSGVGDSSASTLYIADAGNVGLRFDQASTDDIQPCTSTGADRDNAINLGAADNRFKDLYLSGGAYVGSVYNSGIYNQTAGDTQFWVPNVGEAVRIQANTGNLLVGTTTSQATLTVAENQASSFVGHFKNSNGSAYGLGIDTGSGSQIFFYLSGANKGSIISNSSGTAYNTTSDQRLKENIADADDAGSKVDAIQVRKFDWKVDGSHQDYGMIAQELQAVAPEAVSGDADSEEMMGVDYSKLVPMLIKEIQSLRNRVAQLEE